jgi:hypothetical protein
MFPIRPREFQVQRMKSSKKRNHLRQSVFGSICQVRETISSVMKFSKTLVKANQKRNLREDRDKNILVPFTVSVVLEGRSRVIGHQKISRKDPAYAAKRGRKV